MIKVLEIVSWLLLFLLGVVFLVNRWDAITVPYVLLLGLAIFLRLSIRVVKEYDRLVVLRMGRCIGAKGPGPILVFPFMDSVISVDTREQYREIPHESCITKDNARIDVDFLLYYKIRDPELEVTRVQNLQEALGGLATGLLRAVIGDISLDEALAEREHINLQLREKIDEITERWGVEVTTVEIREIVMPPETQEVMNREMAAERGRRATILEAEGYKEAQMLRAQGEATALQLLHDAARQIDQNTLSLKYLETLRHIGDGQATKYVLPMEIMGMARHLTGMLGANDGDGAAPLPKSPEGANPPSVTGADLQVLESLRKLSPEQLQKLIAFAERPEAPQEADDVRARPEGNEKTDDGLAPAWEDDQTEAVT